MSSPDDLTAVGLHVDYEVDRSLDSGPHGLDKAEIPAQQVPVPHAGGDIGGAIGVEAILGDSALHVVVVPGPVGPLFVDEPLVGGVGGAAQSRHIESHCRLHVVPGVGVAAGEPRDHPVAKLPLRNRLGCLLQLVGRKASGDFGDRGHDATPVAARRGLDRSSPREPGRRA